MTARRHRNLGSSAFGMSFLDVVCSGFGASFLLFLIFASLPITPSGGRIGSDHYIDLGIQWPNTSIIVALSIRTPGGEWYDLEHDFEVDSLTGRVTRRGRSVLTNAWLALYVSGATIFGDERLEAMPIGDTSRMALHLRMQSPCAGPWRFAVRTPNLRSDTDVWISKRPPPQTVELSSTARTSQQTLETTVTADRLELLKQALVKPLSAGRLELSWREGKRDVQDICIPPSPLGEPDHCPERPVPCAE